MTTEQSLNASFPIIPLGLLRGDCWGCIVIRNVGENAELRCNECDAEVGVVAEILKALLSVGSLRITCPACGHENTFPGFS
jgi:DNA-directed RNA polymerase subunit RPC12/RpoP